MNQVLRDALECAFLAGKLHRGAENLVDLEKRKAWQEQAEFYQICAWEKLATLPGDVGDAARSELARMKGEIGDRQ